MARNRKQTLKAALTKHLRHEAAEKRAKELEGLEKEIQGAAQKACE